MRGERNMAVKIRLKRIGAKKNPYYRVVIADARFPRDGRFIEQIGTYDPMSNPSKIKIDVEKAKFWIDRGAQPTDTVRALLKKAESAAAAAAAATGDGDSGLSGDSGRNDRNGGKAEGAAPQGDVQESAPTDSGAQESAAKKDPSAENAAQESAAAESAAQESPAAESTAAESAVAESADAAPAGDAAPSE
jgi:small subunit ribosomal protein S16